MYFLQTEYGVTIISSQSLLNRLRSSGYSEKLTSSSIKIPEQTILTRGIFQIITTNLPFSEWVKLFDDKPLTAALLDRITHKAIVLNMNGMNFRNLTKTEYLNI